MCKSFRHVRKISNVKSFYLLFYKEKACVVVILDGQDDVDIRKTAVGILDRVAEWLKIDLWLCVTLRWIRI